MSYWRTGVMAAVVALWPCGALAAGVPEVLGQFEQAARRGELAAAPIPDFSYAGYHAGTALPPVVAGPVFKVTDFGALPDDGKDDIAAIQKAIDAAAKAGGGVVLFPKGTFDFNVDGKGAYLTVRASNIVLRGAGSGPDGTVLYSHHWHNSPDPRKLWMANASPNFLQAGAVTSTAANQAGYMPPPGETVATLQPARPFALMLEVDDASKLKPGTTYLLTQFDPDGSLTEEMARPMRRAQMAEGPAKIGVDKYFQLVGVTKVEGHKVTLDAPVLCELKAAWKPALRAIATLREVGVENLRLKTAWKGPFAHHKNVETDDGWNHLRFDGIENGWVRNVVHEGTTMAVMLASCKHCVVYDSAITGAQGHNGWGAIGGSTYNLVLRCDAGPAFHEFQLQGAPVGNVFLRCKGNARHGIDCHGGLGMHNLFDALNGPGTQHGGSDKATPPRIGRGLVLWNQNPAVKVDHIMPGTVVVGGNGTSVQPESLYEYQRKLRLGAALPATK